MKKRILTLCISLVSVGVYAQTYNMPAATTTYTTCSGTFYDSGGSGGNYGNSENRTVTFCPSTPGAKIRLNFTAFTLENNFDMMYIYDGPNTGSPSLGAYTGTSGPGIVQATPGNASGCITIRFTSDASVTYAGWAATITCITPCQTITANWLGSSPAPQGDGIIRVCQGTPITFNGSGTFSSSGAGATYTWSFGNGNTATGTSVTYTYPSPGAYLVNLAITDPSGCTNNNFFNQVVQISTTPTINLSAAPNPICIGQSSNLTANVTMTPFSSPCTPPVSGTTFLPDGTGVSYSTSIAVNCYAPGQTITSAADFQNVCLNIEHSYLGDLNIVLQCPNGQTMVLKAYPGGGGTYLGCPLDDPAVGPGTGRTYCFTPSAGTLLVSGLTSNCGSPSSPSINAGNYMPVQSFNNLIGCPLNGNWTIIVTDNLASDNGYIFNWDVNFAAALNPPALSFTPTIVSQGWVANPTLTSTGPTTATVTPTVAGSNCYTYSLTDNFGCTYTNNVCVTANSTVTASISPATPTICAGQSTTLTASGGGTYLWNTGATTAAITVSPGATTTYTVTVTGAGGCTASSTRTVTVNPLPTPSISGTNVICVGQSTTLTASGGGTYAWNTGATTAGITVSPGATTTYTVTVTSAAGCTATATRTVTVNPLPTPSISGTTTICAGQSTTLTASGGGTYAWNTGATTAGITVSPGANTTYTVTVTSAAGCTASTSQLVTVNPLPTPSISGTTTICAGQSTTLTASGGGTYAWNTGATTAGISVSPGANTTYTVTVTSAAGCTASTSQLVTVNPLPTPSISGTTTICAGQSTTLTASGGGTYAWNTGATTAGITVSPGANTTYTVTVTSAAGCTASTSQLVTVNPLPTPSISGTTTICVGQSTTLTASGGGTYAWNTGATTAGITVSPGANTTYTVTVTSAAGCTASTSQLVTVNPLPTPSISGTTTICAGQSTTLTASGGGTYAWNTGATTAGITVSPGANTTYTVTITNGPGCTASTSQLVTVNPLPTPAISGTTTICAGQSTTLTASGGGTYAWNTGATTAGITVSPGANTTYTVTVTSAAGCTASTSQLVTVNPLPTPSISGTTTICVGQSTTLTASGGGTYAWNTGATTAGITVSPGTNTTYTVTVTSAAGCTASTSQLVTVNPLPTPSISGTTTICAGQSTTLTASGGGTYAWNTGATTAGITVSPGANTTYTVTATDANGCTASVSQLVTVNPLPTPSVGNNGPLCVGATLNLTSGGGTGYSWSGPGGYTSALQNPSITNVTTAQGGVYTVTVTNANGCTASTTTNVVINPLPTPTAGNNGPLCPTNTLNLTSSGGGAYSWTGPSAFSSALQNPSIPNITSANGGTYTVTVTSAAGCTASASTTVSINPDLVVSANNNSPICAGNTLNLSTAGGVSYSWSGPGGFTSVSQNPSIPNATPANNGTYTVTVTDANGCSGTATTNVTINPLPTPTANNDGPHCTGLTLNLSSTGGTGYSWSGPGGYTSATQNPSITNVTTANSGTYTVTVTDANGCTATATTNVTIYALPTPTANNSGPHCTGLTLNLSATGGTGYSWSGPGGYTSTTQNPSITNVTTANSGTYTVTVTDANGCTGTATTNVTINPLPTPTANNSGPHCTGLTLNLSATGGTGYSWSGPGGYTSAIQNPSITNVTTANSGTYTVTVTDANGCTATASTNVTIYALPTPTANNDGPHCTDLTLNLSATGGTGYSWSGPGGYTSTTQNPSITNVTTANSGTYTVTVTDANSCTATASTNVTIYALPTPTANNNTPVCEGVAVSITSTPAGMASYNWTGPGGYTSTTQNPSITNPTTAESGTYTVTVTDGNGCTATASTVVTVNAMPIPTAGNNGPVCSGVDINLTSSGGASYSWSGPGGYISVAQNPVLSPTTPSMSGTYTVTVSSGAGCSATATTSVTVNALPVPVAANDGPHCEGLVLTLNSMGGVSYNWTGPGGYTSTDQSPVINPTAASQTGTYTVTVTDVNGCTATTSTDVTIYALPVPSATSSGPACQGLSINLASGGGVSYSWVGPNAFSSAMQNPVLNNVDISHAGTYTVTVTSSDGCTASTTVDVVVNPLPQPNYSAANIIGCSPVCADFSDLSVIATGAVTGWEWSANGNVFSNAQNPTQCFSTPGTYDILLTATSDQGCTSSFIINDLVTVYVNPIADFTIYPEVIISNNPTANFTNTSTANAILWNWNFGDGTFGTDENPIHLYADTGQFCITLTVQTAQGCQDTTTHCLYIFPEYKIYIPNTFTPNDDKINDFFTVGGMGFVSVTMEIFNRWGEPVYSTDNLMGWPGTIGSTDEMAKQDVYAYKLNVLTNLGEVFEYYGHVNLIR